ncbi:MAG: aspartate kinase [Brevinematia bacterium]
MLIVQKYGGTSVGNIDRIRNVARRVAKTKDEGNDVVVVVSAMGDTTDYLVELAEQISKNPPKREYDLLLSTGEQISIALLSMALHEMNYKSIAFTGAQVGILTTSEHTEAKILDINVDKIKKELSEGKIVIVAGFQGVTKDGDITTLGRGGSDTTAVALAAALKADLCEIYTDVRGVFTGDPRIIKNARKLDVINIDEVLELASVGAQVLHPRSVIFSKKYKVPLVVRSSFEDDPGTKIVEDIMEGLVVTGVAVKSDEAKVTVLDVPDVPGIAAKLFSLVANEKINVNMIVQGTSRNGLSEINFTIPKKDLVSIKNIEDKIISAIKCSKIIYDSDIAIVSVVGTGMRSHYGVAATVFEVLANKNINIEMISTSEIKISVVVRKDRAEEAANALHEAFKLSEVEIKQV